MVSICFDLLIIEYGAISLDSLGYEDGANLLGFLTPGKWGRYVLIY